MDVKIAYGVPIEEVPKKVKELIDKCNGELANAANICKLAANLLSQGDAYVESAVTLCEDARGKIGSVDRILSDSGMILGGFINYKEKQDEPTQESQPERETDAN